jgi:bleomycin hydrolase
MPRRSASGHDAKGATKGVKQRQEIASFTGFLQEVFMATTLTQAPDTTAGVLGPDDLVEFQKDFASQPAYRLMQNAVTETTIDAVALNREIVTRADHTFSIHLDEWKVTNQKKSGRCWAFAGMNLMRLGAMKKMNVKDFEFSQNYVMFWDKFEKANWFLEAILQTADRDVDDRTVHYLLGRPVDDGGQWNMFVSVVHKYGLVPQALMPETESSSNTPRMNQALLNELRQGARQIRDLKAAGHSDDDCRALKKNILNTIYRILSIHLGTPPSHFLWQWKDKDKKFHRDGELTPQQFAAQYITLDLDDYVCLVHDPRNPYGKTYTVDYLGNVLGGAPVVYLNVDIQLIKDITQKTLEDGEPVWMGCDVGKQMQSDLGIWDKHLFDFEGVYNTTYTNDKAARLRYRQTVMTHAMLFSGVDVVDGKPRRWRVENSWGDERGQKGYYLMNDNWFDEYMFEIATHRKYLSGELLKAFDEEPIVLPAWDPMGSLAHS